MHRRDDIRLVVMAVSPAIENHQKNFVCHNCSFLLRVLYSVAGCSVAGRRRGENRPDSAPPRSGGLFRQPPLHSGGLSCFGSPGPHLAARLDRFVSRRTAFGSRWQALAGSARRNNPQDNTSKSAPSRCAAPIGAQRQSARRPCPWRPAGRRGSCRRPWRRRAGRHRRPASNGPLRGPRHRH